MAFLDLTNIRKIYNDQTAVEDFNLQVERGEFVSFLGPSGCGKTTTLRMIAGFETPSTGTIHLEGRDITNTPPNQRHVGMVFQSYALFPNMTVGENIGFGLTLRKQPKEKVQQRAAELLNLIHLPDKGKQYPYQLSGGQQQRVALARALAIEPHVLLLDEPLSALDAKIRVELRQEIRRIQQHLGITTIYVTHDQEEALSLSDRIVVMSAGKMEQVGTPFEIYNFPTTSFAASFVGQLNLIPVIATDPAAGRCEFNGQSLKVGQTIKAAKGATTRLAIRPEELNLGNAEDMNMLQGKVESVNFLGSVVRTRVDIGGATVSLDLFNERKLVLPKIGDTVTVNFPSHACWTLD